MNLSLEAVVENLKSNWISYSFFLIEIALFIFLAVNFLGLDRELNRMGCRLAVEQVVEGGRP